MHAISAPVLRGLSVLAIGATIVLSHLSFATAKTQKAQIPAQVAVQSKVDISSTGSIEKHESLADNCYWELVSEEAPAGTLTVRRVQECD